MKFRSPTETHVHLASTSGHTFVIGPDLVEVPTRFHRTAVMEGCIPQGMDALPPENDTPDHKKMDLIVAGVRAMMEAARDEDFNGDGRPDVRKLSQRVGFTVLADERNTAWQIVNDDE